MKLIAFLMVVFGGFETYLGLTGKTLRIGRFSFGGGGSTSAPTPMPTTNTTAGNQLDDSISKLLPENKIKLSEYGTGGD
jgi:hypothetical protein